MFRLFKKLGLSRYSIAAILAVFLCVFTITHDSVSASDASWANQNIVYQSNSYIGPIKAVKKSGIDIPEGTVYYSYISETESPSKKKANIIYFAPGQDPESATTATYKTYDLKGSIFSSPSSEQTISLSPSTEINQTSSCVVEGIGWVICPISNFLASGMDWVFSVLRTFIEVQPLNTTDPNNALFSAWNVMRSFANIAFIVAFLIIIYSQITGLGISNYGVKKLFPRLLVAAILVNLSFFICAIAVDISNILGYGLQDMFLQIRNSLASDETQWSSELISWQSITGAVLAGSAGGVAATLGVTGILVATGGSIAGAIFLLLPVLLGLFLTVLIVLLVLAARQAIIIILIVIAPLAFVANLLPNTEKWYQKWQSLFMTLLIFFPAFSVVFGGSQLAGSIIIQNANSILIVILGMIVQVAPLVITPFLIRFSGSTLGKFAAMLNNPRRNLIDKTRKWSSDRAEGHKYQALSSNIRSHNIARRLARDLEYGKMQRNRRKELNKQIFENYATNRRQTTRRDQQDEVRMALAKMQAHEYDERFGLAMDELKANRHRTLDQLSANSPNSLAGRISNRYTPRAHQRFIHEAMHQAVELDIDGRATSSARLSAKNVQARNYSNRIQADVHLRDIAGGIDDHGAQRAMANAVASITQANQDALKNIRVIIDNINPTSDAIINLASGTSIANANNQLVIEATVEARATALDMIFSGRNNRQILDALRQIDFSFPDQSNENREQLQIAVANAIQSNPNRPPMIGAGAIDNIRRGRDFRGQVFIQPYGDAGLDDMIIDAINKEKFDTNKLKAVGSDVATAILNAIDRNRAALSDSARTRLQQELGATLDPNRVASEQLGDSRRILEEILNRL